MARPTRAVFWFSIAVFTVLSCYALGSLARTLSVKEVAEPDPRQAEAYENMHCTVSDVLDELDQEGLVELTNLEEFIDENRVALLEIHRQECTRIARSRGDLGLFLAEMYTIDEAQASAAKLADEEGFEPVPLFYHERKKPIVMRVDPVEWPDYFPTSQFGGGLNNLVKARVYERYFAASGKTAR